MFAMSTNGVDSSHLLTIDLVTREATQIGGNNGLTLPISIAATPTASLLVLDNDDDAVYGVDKATGVVSLIGPAGFDANFGQGMAYDKISKKVLMTAYNATIGDSQLRELNPITGMSTNLGTITPGMQDQFGWVAWYDRDLLDIGNKPIEEITIYPNPVENELILNAVNPIDLIVIYNMLGQKLYVQTPLNTSVTIDLSYFETGTYLIQSTINKQLGYQRFIKK